MDKLKLYMFRTEEHVLDPPHPPTPGVGGWLGQKLKIEIVQVCNRATCFRPLHCVFGD